MPDLFENPIGLDGFEFVEFCAPEKGMIEPVFEAMGFSHVADHRSKDVQLWRQGQINPGFLERGKIGREQCPGFAELCQGDELAGFRLRQDRGGKAEHQIDVTGNGRGNR